MNKKNYKKISLTTLFILSIFIIPSFSFAAVVNKTISEPLTSGLVGHWTMDGKDSTWSSDTVGTIADKSGNGNTGTFTNMSRAISQVAGKVGQALKFDGTNDYINVGDIEDVSIITLSAWVKNVNVAGNYNSIVAKRDGITNATAWAFDKSIFDGTLRFYINNGSFAIWDTDSVQLINNVWYHVVVTYDGSTAPKFYVDGVLVPSTAGSGPAILNNNIVAQIGKFQNSSGTDSPWNGSLDDVRIYNRALSATEITQLYNLNASKYNVTPTQPLTSGLVGHWTMDGKDTVWTSSTAATVIDRSGNGNTGTLTNMSQSTSPVLGKIGQAMKFDGSNDRINVPSMSSLSSVSASAWFKIQGSMNTYARIMEKGANTMWAILCINNTISIQNVSTFTTSPLTYNDGKWHHMTMTGSPTTIKL